MHQQLNLKKNNFQFTAPTFPQCTLRVRCGGIPKGSNQRNLSEEEQWETDEEDMNFLIILKVDEAPYRVCGEFIFQACIAFTHGAKGKTPRSSSRGAMMMGDAANNF